MNKIEADRVQQTFNLGHQYEAAYDYFSSEQLRHLLLYLNQIQTELERTIAHYSLESTHDLLDDETPQIVRVFWFSRGIQDYYICVDGSGVIRAADHQTSKTLLRQVNAVIQSIRS